jgi:hypothetical protein
MLSNSRLMYSKLRSAIVSTNSMYRRLEIRKHVEHTRPMYGKSYLVWRKVLKHKEHRIYNLASYYK